MAFGGQLAGGRDALHIPKQGFISRIIPSTVHERMTRKVCEQQGSNVEGLGQIRPGFFTLAHGEVLKGDEPRIHPSSFRQREKVVENPACLLWSTRAAP